MTTADDDPGSEPNLLFSFTLSDSANFSCQNMTKRILEKHNCILTMPAAPKSNSSYLIGHWEAIKSPHQSMICGETFREDESLMITSYDASKITIVFQTLESKVDVFKSKEITQKQQQKFSLLRKKLKKLRAIRIHWIAATPELRKFSVCHFRNLECLELVGCPASSIIGNLMSHLSRLRKLVIDDSDELDMSRLLLPWRGEASLPLIEFPLMVPNPEINEDAGIERCWQSLILLKISKCGIGVLGNALHYLPVVTSIDFSHNNISQVIHFQDCFKLDSLNISYNRIRVLSNMSRVLGNISILNIAHNQVECLDGIDKLYAIRTLDLSYNLIDDFLELKYLTKLPCLESLHLMGNPISQPRKGRNAVQVMLKSVVLMVYRRLVFKHLLLDGLIVGAGRALPMLDNQLINDAQRRSLR